LPSQLLRLFSTLVSITRNLKFGRTEYDENGLFAVAESNGELETIRKEWDPSLGLLVRSWEPNSALRTYRYSGRGELEAEETTLNGKPFARRSLSRVDGSRGVPTSVEEKTWIDATQFKWKISYLNPQGALLNEKADAPDGTIQRRVIVEFDSNGNPAAQTSRVTRADDFEFEKGIPAQVPTVRRTFDSVKRAIRSEYLAEGSEERLEFGIGMQAAKTGCLLERHFDVPLRLLGPPRSQDRERKACAPQLFGSSRAANRRHARALPLCETRKRSHRRSPRKRWSDHGSAPRSPPKRDCNL
jgi:hypothetical protein